MNHRNYWLTFTLVFSFFSGASAHSFQGDNLQDCLQRLDSAVRERESYFRTIDDRYLNRDDRSFVGSQRITSYSESIDGTVDVQRNLDDCQYAADNYEYFNERLRDIANTSAGNQERYDSCFRELEDVVSRHNNCRVTPYQLRRYDGVEDCEVVMRQVKGWLRDAEASARCPQ